MFYLVPLNKMSEYAGDDCERAVIDFNAVLKAKLLNRHADLLALKASDESIYALRYLDESPVYVNESVGAELLNGWENEEANLTPLKIQKYPAIVERMDPITLNIYETGFCWSTSAKHWDYEIETVVFEWEWLQVLVTID